MARSPRPPLPSRPPRKPSSPPAAPSPAGGTELVYGYRAVLALVARRPEDIVEIHAQGDLVPRLSELASWARSRGVPLREPGERELLKLTGTSNHEGLCALTRPRRWLSPGEFAEQLVRARGAAIALDRVRNPYNIGAILRSAAFFGLDGALLGAPAPHPALAQDAVRVAEGGAEHLRLSRTTDLADTLGRLRARGVQVIGAESDGGAGLAGYPFRRPTLVVLGNEREGLGDRIRAQCDALVRIDGSGAIGSLNVSIAASLMIAELVRPAGKSV